jgi:hypothetical protein
LKANEKNQQIPRELSELLNNKKAHRESEEVPG